jgi:hypothetical protein
MSRTRSQEYSSCTHGSGIVQWQSKQVQGKPGSHGTAAHAYGGCISLMQQRCLYCLNGCQSGLSSYCLEVLSQIRTAHDGLRAGGGGGGGNQVFTCSLHATRSAAFVQATATTLSTHLHWQEHLSSTTSLSVNRTAGHRQPPAEQDRRWPHNHHVYLCAPCHATVFVWQVQHKGQIT